MERYAVDVFVCFVMGSVAVLVPSIGVNWSFLLVRASYTCAATDIETAVACAPAAVRWLAKVSSRQ